MTTEQIETRPDASTDSRRRPSWVRAALWVVALVLAGSAMVYQKLTGPTEPYRDRLVASGETYKLKFPRTWELVARSEVDPEKAGAEVTLPAKPRGVSATVHWRRYPTKDAFVPTPMAETIRRVQEKGKPPEEERTYGAEMPPQPPAGKVEYFVTVDTPEGERRFPPGDDAIVLRYKDFVPRSVLYPHIGAMILVIIVGMRAGLSALFDPATTRRYAWAALILMTLGGMTLGPLVQKYAFGEYWTGFPWGGDWTDNKMLFMWLAWVVACVVLGAATRPVTKIGRATTVLAAVVMTAVYLIPHSMGGSQLDYSAVEKGVDPKDAIRTGKQE